jgi:hypothetical protein
MTPRRILLVCALAAPVLASACSDDDTVTSTTSTGRVADSATTTPDQPAATTTPDAAGSPEVSVAVYWTRPLGTPRPIDIPAYRDPAGGPYPFVLYGSATNDGAASVDAPVVEVEWELEGRVVHRASGQLFDPGGVPLSVLAAGESADLLVLVDDETVAAALVDATPTFAVVPA